MIDIIGAISLTAIFALCCVVVIAALPVEAVLRSRFAAAAAAWFVGIALLGAAGVFSGGPMGTPAIGLAVVAPVALLPLATLRSSTLRRVALHTPLALLVGIHAGRLLGVFFLWLLEEGRLPRTFAITAGWGDIAVALAAIPLAGPSTAAFEDGRFSPGHGTSSGWPTW
jgi:hypothetical protein